MKYHDVMNQLLVIASVLLLFIVLKISYSPLILRDRILEKVENEEDNFEVVEKKRIRVFEMVAPSVANIDTFVDVDNDLMRFVSPNESEVKRGSGSGFFWDNKGHVVTNYHVVQYSDKAKVSFRNQSTGDWTFLDAKLVGVDILKDIAVLKVNLNNAESSKPIRHGSSVNLKVGQSVLAIGSPFGLDYTLTSGIVSAKGREMKSPNGYPISNVIQTDASINPGSSGGPLLDYNGNVVGVNTKIISQSRGNVGIAFAIPIEAVTFSVEALIRHGEIIRPRLGISYIDSSQAQALGAVKGIVVMSVEPNSPAQKAGIKGTKRNQYSFISGDIITKIENHQIENEIDLFKALDNYKPGDKVDVTLQRRQNSTQIRIITKVQLGSSSWSGVTLFP